MSNELDRIERLIQDGQQSNAYEYLKQINRAKLSITETIRVSRLYRLAGYPREALTILTQSLKRSIELGQKDNELQIEYAASLSRIGAFNTAERMLLDSKNNVNNDRDFQLGLLYMTIWDYQTSLEYFDDLIDTEKDNPKYLANHAASLAFLGHYERAIQSAKISYEIFDQRNDLRLKAATLELMTSIYLGMKNLSKSESCIKEFETLPLQFQTGPSIFIKKWKALLEHEKKQDISDTVKKLKKLRLEIPSGVHHETVREIKYLIARLTNNTKEILDTYFSTPFESYRHKILRENQGLEIPSHHVVYIGEGVRSDIILDLYDPKKIICNEELSDGLVTKAIHALISDTIKPMHIASFTDEIYPGEDWVLNTTEKKVGRILARTRKYLESKSLSVELSNGFLCLNSEGKAVGINRLGHIERRSQIGVILRGIERQFGMEFTAKQAREWLGYSTGKMHSLITGAEKAGLLDTFGNSKKRRYKILIPRKDFA